MTAKKTALSAKVTKKSVFDACAKLEAENKSISQINVRSALGSGSFTTIGPWIAEYKSMKVDPVSDHQRALPEELESSLNDLAIVFWNKASDLAEAERKAFRDDYEQKKKEADEQLKEKDDLIEYLETEIDRYQKANADLNAKLLKLKGTEAEFAAVTKMNDSLQALLDKHLERK